MKAGRVRAAEKRKLEAKNTTAMPAGHERDEQRRINKDVNEERLEVRDEQQGTEAVDPAKLAHRDRETLSRIEEMNREDVENPQPGYRYARITCPEGYSYNAKANIRQMKALAEKAGYEPVHGTMPEDERFKGNDHASGGTLRGLADTFLWRIREEDYQELQRQNAIKAARQGAIEQETVRYAESRGVGTMHAAAGDFASQDKLLASVAQGAGKVEHFRPARPGEVQTKFSEGDIRRGSMRGPDGRTLKPGFERENLAGR
jgi:hypothetical protein